MSQKMTKACLKSSDIPVTTFHRSNTQFPIVESSHSVILYLDFSWNTRLSIWDHWEPWGVVGSPFEAENDQNKIQIIRYSFVRLSCNYHPVFLQLDHPIVICCISTFHGTLGHPLGTVDDPGGALGGPSEPENDQNMPQII